MARTEGSRRGPFLALAILLHLGLLLALTLAPKPSRAPTGEATPVTIVSEGPPSPPPKAAIAPEVTPAQAPEPDVSAPPPEPAPAAPPPPRPAPPKPRPAPPKPPPPKPTPRPTPTPRPKVAPKPQPAPTPKPAPPATAKPQPKPKRSLDLDALQASLAAEHPVATRAAAAQRGPSRAATAPVSGTAHTVSASEQAGLSQLLNRLWNPNCSVEGGDAVLVTVTFAVGPDGRLAGRASAGGKEGSSDPVVYAAARRAIDAVHAVEPYQATYRSNTFRINFDARKACANR